MSAALLLAWSCGATSTPSAMEPLQLQLSSPAEARAGAPIRFTLTLRNTSTQPVQVMFGGRPPYDFVVATPDGARSWRWSDGQAIQMILEMRTLQPGEQIVYDAEWLVKDSRDNVLPAGRYVVRGELKLDPPEKMETTPKELLVINSENQAHKL